MSHAKSHHDTNENVSVLVTLSEQLDRQSTERLLELEDNVELSKAFHDGRTTAALRSLEKHRRMHMLIQQICNEIHTMEGSTHASSRC